MTTSRKIDSTLKSNTEHARLVNISWSCFFCDFPFMFNCHNFYDCIQFKVCINVYRYIKEYMIVICSIFCELKFNQAEAYGGHLQQRLPWPVWNNSAHQSVMWLKKSWFSFSHPTPTNMHCWEQKKGYNEAVPGCWLASTQLLFSLCKTVCGERTTALQKTSETKSSGLSKQH